MSQSYCISLSAFVVIILSIRFATAKIPIYNLTAVSFTAHIIYKPCLLEINEFVGSGAGRKPPVNIKEAWGHFGMKSENQMFMGSECMRQLSIHSF